MNSIRNLIADDSFAISFQTMGQYRTALLKALDAPPPAPEVGPALADLENLELAFESNFGCKVRTSRIRPVLLHYATLLQQQQQAAPAPAVVPVAVSERPWEREGWCDEQRRCWWIQQWPDSELILFFTHEKPFHVTHCLPAHAIQLPQVGEVGGENASLLDELRQIGHRLRTQYNRCTADPIFQVQVQERIYGFDSSCSDDFEWKDDDYNSVEIPEGADPDSPPRGVTVVRYTTIWKVVMVAFTEEGCKEHLRLNGHNYRGEVRIYADSLYRCPEMIAVRKFLMELSAPLAWEVES